MKYEYPEENLVTEDLELKINTDVLRDVALSPDFDVEKLRREFNESIGPLRLLVLAKRLGEERKAYKKFLETYIPLEGIPEDAKVLSLGCHAANEALMQNGFLGRKPYGESEEIKIFGVDINKKGIEMARKQYSPINPETNVKEQKNNYQFIRCDARNLPFKPGQNFDVIFASHPEILHRTEVWSEIIDEAKTQHRSGGLFIGTCYYEKEMELLELALGRNYEILGSGRNIHAKKRAPRSELEAHKYYLVARKN